jgi:hypothetical protein
MAYKIGMIPKASNFTLGTTPEQLAKQARNTQNQLAQRGGATNAPGLAQRAGTINYAQKISGVNDLANLNQRKAKLQAAIKAKGGNAPGYTAQLAALEGQIGRLNTGGGSSGTSPIAPEAPAPATGGPLTTPTPQFPAEDPNAVNRADEINKILFADTTAFGDNQAYNRANEQGSKQIAQLMSARGLLGAGKDLATNAEFQADLNAKESERVNAYLGQKADRLYGVLRDEADRAERSGNRASDSQLRLLEMALAQNPLQYGYNAANQLSGLTQEEAQQLAKYISSNYQTVRSGGGGGGVGPFVPPFPTGPNMTAANLQGIMNSQASSNNNLNLLNSFVSGLSKAG